MNEVIARMNKEIEKTNSIILVKMFGDRPKFTLYVNNGITLETFDFNLLKETVESMIEDEEEITREEAIAYLVDDINELYSTDKESKEKIINKIIYLNIDDLKKLYNKILLINKTTEKEN